MVSPTKKVVLITGCSSGFGRSFVEALAGQGHIIAASARRLGSIQDLQADNVFLYELDVTKKDTIDRCISQIIEDHGRIDVLINNAGYGYMSLVEFAEQQAVKDQFETNYFGLLQTTQAVIPYMRKQRAGQIINISSAAAYAVTPTMGLYASTKWALDCLSEAMHFELKSFGIKVSTINPGPYDTDFNTRSIKRDDDLDKDPPAYESLFAKLDRFGSLKKMSKKGAPVQEVADLVARVIKKKNPRLHYPCGKTAKFLYYLRKLLGNKLFIRFEELIFKTRR